MSASPPPAQAKGNRWGFKDLGVGVGLRTVHFGYILAQRPPVDWFEVLSENYLDTGGRPLYILDQVCERYPVALHGVSMSIGSTDPLDVAYLTKLKALADRTRAHWVSDHLCWTGVLARNTHDLLPMPYTEEALAHTVRRARQASEILERPLILENPSSYVEFKQSALTEWEFLARLAQEADCGLLLDVNNVYVSSFNHGFDPRAYIDGIPADRVVQFHVAGHTHKGTHILDTHSDHALPEVWELYRQAWSHTGGAATLYEWDEDIPDFEVLLAEAQKALRFREPRASTATVPLRHAG